MVDFRSVTATRLSRFEAGFLAVSTLMVGLASPTGAAVPTCRGHKATIVGTSGSDALQGTPKEDIIVAGGGDDTITMPEPSGSGYSVPEVPQDRVCGGGGDDVIRSPVGLSILDGGPGTDTVEYTGGPIEAHLGKYGGAGSAIRRFGEGAYEDVLYDIENLTGSTSDDVLIGGPGPNVIRGSGGYDWFAWHPTDTGDDTWDGTGGGGRLDFSRATGPAIVDLAAGEYSVLGAGTGSDSTVGIHDITGSFFADVLAGDNEVNKIESSNTRSEGSLLPFAKLDERYSADSDDIQGLGGDDVLLGSAGFVTIDGGEGADWLEALAFRPVEVIGGEGADTFITSDLLEGNPYPGTSTFHMGPGSDSVLGTNMDDQIFGEEGPDSLEGEGQDDVIDGGPDQDHARGGTGADTCINIESFGSPDCSGPAPNDEDRDANVHVTPALDADLQVDIDRLRLNQYVVTVTNFGPAPTPYVSFEAYFGGAIRSLEASTPQGPEAIVCDRENSYQAFAGDTADCLYGGGFSDGHDFLPGDVLKIKVRVNEHGNANFAHVAAAMPGATLFGGDANGVRDPSWSNNVAVFTKDAGMAKLNGLVFDGDKFADGHENRLDGVKVELFKDGALVQGPITANLGAYSFTGLAPGRYRLRVTLVDQEHTPALFEVRYAQAGVDPVWLESSVQLDPGSNRFDMSVSAAQNPNDVNPSVPAAEWDRLDDMGNLYFRLDQYIEWLIDELNVTMSTATLPVPIEVYAFDNTAGMNNAFYTPTDTSMHIHPSLSAYSLRDGVANDAGPESIEWHEFNHHVFVTNIREADCDGGGHNGYLNATTCASMDEGFAAFLPTAAWNGLFGADDAHYDAFGINLESNGLEAWGTVPAVFAPGTPAVNVHREEFAVAALLWDLVDDDSDVENTEVAAANNSHVAATFRDDVDLTVEELWAVMNGANTDTVGALRNALFADASLPAGLKQVSLDLDGDGTADVAPLDGPFLMHGFYPVLAAENSAAHMHYDVEVASDLGIPGVDRNRAVGRTDHPVAGGGSPVRNFTPRVPGAYLELDVESPDGSALDDATAVLEVHYPELTDRIEILLDGGADNRIYLELPPYFSGRIVEGEPLPGCGSDPAYPVAVSVSATFDGETSDQELEFDNCAYFEAVVSATDGVALSQTLTVPRAQSTITGKVVSKGRQSIVVKGTLEPSHPGRKVTVELQKKRGKKWVTVHKKRPTLKKATDRNGDGIFESRFEASLSRPGASSCRVQFAWRGDSDHLPIKGRTRPFNC